MFWITAEWATQEEATHPTKALRNRQESYGDVTNPSQDTPRSAPASSPAFPSRYRPTYGFAAWTHEPVLRRNVSHTVHLNTSSQQ